MWPALGAGFLAQGEALVYAELVLLIDHHQAQALKSHALLKQGVGTHREGRLAGGEPRGRRCTRFPFHPPTEPLHTNTQGCEPRLEVESVLLGKDFRRRHERHLKAVGDGLQGGMGRHQGFSGADITLHQAQHGHGPGQVRGDFRHDTLLCPGQAEGQTLQ